MELLRVMCAPGNGVAVPSKRDDLASRKAELLRRRLEKHTGLTGTWVRPPKKTQVVHHGGKDAIRFPILHEEDVEMLDEEIEYEEQEAANAPTDLPEKGAKKSINMTAELTAASAWEKRHRQADLVKEDLQEKWRAEQVHLRDNVMVRENKLGFQWEGVQGPRTLPKLQYVAGMDLSFIPKTDLAVASLIVFEYPSLKVVYEANSHCTCYNPYIPGFLAYREMPGLMQAWNDLLRTNPSLKPQLVLLDGNGTIHHRGFGLACHFGVTVDVPTIGIAKSLLCVDGLSRDQVEEKVRDGSVGDVIDLWGTSGRVWGHCLVTSKEKPIYVSPGHRVSLNTAVKIVKSIWDLDSSRNIPLPTRAADALSRKYIKKLEEQHREGDYAEE